MNGNSCTLNVLLSNDTDHVVDAALFQPILARLPEVLPGITHTTVELHLTNDAAIQQLNKQYRDKDKPTDVLSFNLEDDETLGQMVISLETTQRQADELSQSFEAELQFLFTHGLLHLLGFDHEEPEEEKEMLRHAYALLNRTQ